MPGNDVIRGGYYLLARFGRPAEPEHPWDTEPVAWCRTASTTPSRHHHSGQWFLSWPIYAGGPDPAGSAHEQGLTLRAAIDAAMAADTQTEGS